MITPRYVKHTEVRETNQKIGMTAKGAQGGGVKPPLELDILQKLYYLRKGD